ncbi:MAG TPA: acetylxylan esterase [Bryobacteraceae bacterium]|nr:acetylxylan esterase [Bryobacteraceae bacterium]
MTRRTALAVALGGASRTTAGPIDYHPYSRVLPAYLEQLVAEAYRSREAALARLTTPAAVRERQAWIRDTFWTLVGGRPEPSPLNLKSTGEFTRPGYRCEKVVYESQPGLFVTGLFYVPAEGSGPFPGVLFQPGHSLNGKAAEPYQKFCQSMARLGFVVLTFDPMGQGERTNYPEAGKLTTRLGSADEEHSRPGRQMLLVGETATRMQTWDAVRALDVLASHPRVDTKRLASTGQSGGGTLTMFLAAVDDRLTCAAVSCGNTENFACASFLAPGSTDDAEQNFIGGSARGFERWDTVYGLAPKPLWVGVSARDWFGTYSPGYLQNGRAEFAKLKAAYHVLGNGNAIEWYETAVPHALSHDLRVQMYLFFNRWMKGVTNPVTEPPAQVEPDAVLQVGKTGNVVRDFRSETPLSLLTKRTLPAPAANWPELLNVDRPALPGKPAVIGRASGEGCTIEGIEVASARDVRIPAWLYRPNSGDSGRVLLALEPRGRNARWREDDLWHKLAASGWTVCAFDVRGLGDLWPEVGRGNAFYARPHNEEEAWAWASLMLGKPLAGQRVTDILAVANAVRGKQRTVLAALGHTAVPALCAAAIDSRIDLVYASGALRSWASLLQEEDYSEPLANFVPGILTRTDLPQIRKTLGARLKEGTRWDLETLQSL